VISDEKLRERAAAICSQKFTGQVEVDADDPKIERLADGSGAWVRGDLGAA
jgi:hypothetical protein